MTELLQHSLGPSQHRNAFSLVAAGLADANQLEMALLNLVVNTRDAMSDGGQIVIATNKETVEPAIRN